MTQGEMTLSNEQLAERIRQGDDHLFALLVERMTPMLRCEVASLRCNHADGDDMAQEALLALLAAVEKFRPDGGASFLTFARVCVRNRLSTAIRLLRSPETPHDDEVLFDEIDHEAATTDPGNWLLDREKDLALIDRLKVTLSDLEYRVLMFHLAAYSYEEIASSIGVSVKSVDNALQRIRRKLAAFL